MAAKKKTPAKKSSKRAKLAPALVKRGLSATEVALPIEHEEINAVVELVRKAGGAPLGAYREPLGGRPLLLASLPLVTSTGTNEGWAFFLKSKARTILGDDVFS